MEDAKGAHRRNFSAQKGQDLASGKVMRLLLKWELWSSIFVFAFWLSFGAYHLRALTLRGEGPEDDEVWTQNVWVLWSSLYYCRFCCASSGSNYWPHTAAAPARTSASCRIPAALD